MKTKYKILILVALFIINLISLSFETPWIWALTFLLFGILSIVFFVQFIKNKIHKKSKTKNINDTAKEQDITIEPRANNDVVPEPEEKDIIVPQINFVISSNRNSSTKVEKKNKIWGDINDYQPYSYVVIDIETTGFTAEFDDIIEIAVIKVENGIVSDRFTTLLKEENTVISKKITEITGITNELIADAPSFSQVCDSLVDFIGDFVIVGHNISFDVNFINNKLKKCNKNILTNDCFDTLKLSRKLIDIPHHRLIDVAEYFNIIPDNSHRALSDCVTTQKCYEELRKLNIPNLPTYSEFPFEYNNSFRQYVFSTVKILKPNIDSLDAFTEPYLKISYKDPEFFVLDENDNVIGKMSHAGAPYKMLLSWEADSNKYLIKLKEISEKGAFAKVAFYLKDEDIKNRCSTKTEKLNSYNTPDAQSEMINLSAGDVVEYNEYAFYSNNRCIGMLSGNTINFLENDESTIRLAKIKKISSDENGYLFANLDIYYK